MRRPVHVLRSRAAGAIVLSVVVAATAGCGSSAKSVETSTQQATAPTGKKNPLTPAELGMRKCFRRHGYAITPDSAHALGTAPARFQFLTVWNLVNPNRIALAVTISRSAAGAGRAAVWTRDENKKISKGAVKAPVVRFGQIDVLWTNAPDRRDTQLIYGCVRPASRT